MRRRGRWRYGLAGVGLIGIIAITAMAFPGLNRHFLKKRVRASLERLSTATGSTVRPVGDGDRLGAGRQRRPNHHRVRARGS